MMDTQSCTLLGPAAEEVTKKGVVLCVKCWERWDSKETCSSWHSTPQLAWLQLGLLGMLPTPCCAVSPHGPGIATPRAFQSCFMETESLLVRPAVGSQYVPSSVAEYMDQKGLTSLASSSSHDFTWGKAYFLSS